MIREARELIKETLCSERSTTIRLPLTAPGMVDMPGPEAVAFAAALSRGVSTEPETASAPETSAQVNTPAIASCTSAPPTELPRLPTQTTEEVQRLNGLAIPAMIEAVIRLKDGSGIHSCASRANAVVCPLSSPCASRICAPEAPAKALPVVFGVVTGAGTCGDFASILVAETKPRPAGLCSMLDYLESAFPHTQNSTSKRARLDQTDAVSEFRYSLNEVNNEILRAESDSGMTWDPGEIFGAIKCFGGRRIPRPSTFLRIASLYDACISGFVSQHRQLRNFDWLTENVASSCIAVACDLVPDLEAGAFEYYLRCEDYYWCGDSGLRLRSTIEEALEVHQCLQSAVISDLSPYLQSEPLHVSSERKPAASPSLEDALPVSNDLSKSIAVDSSIDAQPTSFSQVTSSTDGHRTAAQAAAAALRLDGSRPVLIEGRVDISECTAKSTNGCLCMCGHLAATVTPTAIWELKCVDSLRGEHFLQLAVYAWLWEAGGSLEALGPRTFRLANLLTGEMVSPMAQPDTLDTLPCIPLHMFS